jgi:hypothetical protein
MPKSSLLDLSYDVAIRALDLQERAVEQLRARTGTLLAASSLTATFLGSQTVRHTGGLDTLQALALISLSSSVVLCVYVLSPKREFVFSMNAVKLYERLFHLADDDEEVRRRLIYWLDEFWQSNQDKIAKLDRFYLAAAAALMLQLIFWSAALTDIIV